MQIGWTIVEPVVRGAEFEAGERAVKPKAPTTAIFVLTLYGRHYHITREKSLGKILVRIVSFCYDEIMATLLSLDKQSSDALSCDELKAPV